MFLVSREGRALPDSEHLVTANSCIYSHIFALTLQALAVAETRTQQPILPPPPPFLGQNPTEYTGMAPAVLFPGYGCCHMVRNWPLIPAVIGPKGRFIGLCAQWFQEATRDAVAHTHGKWLCQYPPMPLGFHVVSPVIYYLLPLRLSSHLMALPFLPSLHPKAFLLLFHTHAAFHPTAHEKPFFPSAEL